MTLGGNVVIRNGNTLDYCWRECIKSLLPVCDVVSVCDAESTDDTQQEVREWMKHEPKLSLCVWPWPNPKGDREWFVKWINYSREHVHADYQIQLDADEVLDERSYDAIGRFKKIASDSPKTTALISRLNFWRDHRHLIPEGHCLAHKVIRIAPQTMWLPSDGSTGHPLEGIPGLTVSEQPDIRIFHYGFIRKREAFFKKEKEVQTYFFNYYDPSVAKSESFDGNWMNMPGISTWQNDLTEYRGHHPAVMKDWLINRGYE